MEDLRLTEQEEIERLRNLLLALHMSVSGLIWTYDDSPIAKEITELFKELDYGP